MSRFAVVSAIVAVLCASAFASGAHAPGTSYHAASDAPHHDKDFWRAIKKNGFKVPEGNSAAALVSELSAGLGSEDPELRDDLGYEILTAWIYQNRTLAPAEIRALTAEWLKNIAATSDGAPNAALRRSFSALMLSVVVARDNAEPFLDKPEFRAIWNGALAYLRAEKDLRGFDPRVGWVHSAAHTADLLKFLARSRFVEPQDQASLLAAIREKLTTAPLVFAFGEDERCARTVLSIVMRKDFDQQSFEAWAKEMRPAFPEGVEMNQSLLFSIQNRKNLLAKLAFILSTQDQSAPAVTAAGNAVRESLKNTF